MDYWIQLFKLDVSASRPLMLRSEDVNELSAARRCAGLCAALSGRRRVAATRLQQRVQLLALTQRGVELCNALARDALAVAVGARICVQLSIAVDQILLGFVRSTLSLQRFAERAALIARNARLARQCVSSARSPRAARPLLRGTCAARAVPRPGSALRRRCTGDRREYSCRKRTSVSRRVCSASANLLCRISTVASIVCKYPIFRYAVLETRGALRAPRGSASPLSPKFFCAMRTCASDANVSAVARLLTP